MTRRSSLTTRGAGLGLGAALALGLSGCASPPPRKDTAAAWLQQAQYQQATTAGTPVTEASTPWWHAAGSEPLNRLVALGLQHNLDVKLALTRVREARAGETAQASVLWPTLSLQGAYANQRTGLPAAVKQGKPDTRAAQLTLNLDWELDLLGRQQAQRNGAQEDLLASEAGVAGARLMLVADIARQHRLHQGALQREAALAELIALQRQVLHVLNRRAQEGEESLLTVDAAQARLDEWLAQQRALHTLRTVTRARLLTLTAAPAEAVDACLGQAPAAHTTDAPTLPPPVPTGQPIELLARRPDIIAARAQWRAEQARRQAAQLDLLPRFFVSLVTGRQDLRIQGLDLPPVGLHQTALAFALPLFNAGRIQAGIERQDAVLERAELRYAQAVRQALEDVDSALVDLQQNTERAHDLARVEASRARAAARGAHLYAEGQVALTDRLALSQAQVGATLARIEATEAAWLSHIQLHRALGGGWQHSPAPTAHTPADTSLHTTSPTPSPES